MHRFFLSLFLMGSTLPCMSIPNYEVYLESWDSQWNQAMTHLPTPSGYTSQYQEMTANVCFAAYLFPGLNGLQFSDLSTDVATFIDYVHLQGGKARISYGGASYAEPYYPNYFISQTEGWPGNISSLASGVIDVVQSYGFDGVDFDIEDPLPSNTTAETFASQLLSFLQQVRAGLPSSLISITIPGQSWGQYWQYLAQEVAATPGLVDYINFMEYDIWINPSLPSTSNQYQQQIMADITTYTSPTTTAPAPNYAPGWGLPVPLVQTGLMGGYDDLGHYLTPEASSNLSSMAEDLGLYGIMFWDLDRDAGTNASPPTTDQPPYTYSDTIRSSLLNPISTSRFTPAKSTKASFSKNCGRQTLFLKYLPPPHGAPAH